MVEKISMEDIEAIAQGLGIDLSAVNVDSIKLPLGEDFGIKSDDDEDLYHGEALELEIGFRNIIVVDNLPVVPPEKFEKLEGVIRKIYSQIGVIRDGGLWMPVNPETQKTLGYCFIEYNTTQEAELAKEKTNGYKLDKSHIFAVNLFDQFEKYMKIPDEWTPAEIKPYIPGENLQKWLTDEKARDQFVIRAGAFTEVFWNDPRQMMPELVYRRQVLIGASNASKEKAQAHIRELEEEVKLLKNLSHPNIVRYLGTVREEETLNILLEFVPGGSISSLLGKFGSFPEAVIKMYTKQILQGMEYLHRNGIMHRDIKGANILVDNKGCIKLAYFSASKQVAKLATMTAAKSMKGTPYWMAPEVILQTGHTLACSSTFSSGRTLLVEMVFHQCYQSSLKVQGCCLSVKIRYCA